MVVSSIEVNITWLNVFPMENGISKTLSTSEIVLGIPNIDATHATLQPVSYVNYKVKARRTNDTKTRSVAEIAFRRSNKHGKSYPSPTQSYISYRKWLH